MKILIINGSPHLGNTWKLTNLVRKELESFSNEIEFEEIHLMNMDLPLCVGCSLCFRKGHSHCPHSKTMQVIMDKIESSDGVIFSTSTFGMHVTALAKNFLDHLCYMLHRPRYFKKVGLIISTTGGVGAKVTTKYTAGLFEGWGFNRCYQLPLSSNSWNDYIPKKKHIKRYKVVTRKFYKTLTRKKPHSPKLGVMIPYNIFRGMSKDYEPGTEFPTQDGVFWKETGLINQAYSPQVPLPVYKKVLGNGMCYLASIASKFMKVNYKK